MAAPTLTYRKHKMKRSNKLKSVIAASKREHRARRSAVHAKLNHRTPVIQLQPDTPSPLQHLSEKFRNSAVWRPPVEKGPVTRNTDNHMVMMIRRPPDENERLDNRFVAVNSKTYNEESLEYQPGLQQLLWQEVLDYIRPMTPDFAKSGAAICDHIKLDPSKDLVERAVSVHDIDDDTYRAVNAALFTAYNTSAAPADMETVAIALAAFIHAHPHFKGITDGGEFHQPFGEDTAWKLLRPFAS